MRITEIRVRTLETVVAEPLPPRGDAGYSTYQHKGSERQRLLALEMRTDAGPTGIAGLGGCGEPAMRRILEHFGPALMDAGETDLRAALRLLRSLSTESADRAIVNRLEFALWDILGKERGQPVYELLGGSPPAGGLEVYASSLYFAPLEDVIARARRLISQGFRGMKVKIGHGPEEDIALVRSVRETVGPGICLSMDANRAYDLDGALRLMEGLADAGVAWFEEPFPYVAGVKTSSPWPCNKVDDWGIEQYRKLRAATDIPLAGAEGFRDFGPISRLLAAGCLDIVQPDTGYLGLSAMLAAIELAEEAGVTPTPHSCTDTMGLLVSLHLQALTGNPVPQEYETFESPFVQDLFAGQRGWVRPDGTVAVPSGPGLGVEFDEGTCERYCLARGTVTA